MKETKVWVLFMVLFLVTGGAPAVGADQHPSDRSDSANENSEADITVVFDADCAGFHVESSKDISFVSINNNTTFTYVKYEDGELAERDEGDSEDRTTFEYSQDEEIKSIVVKSGTTMLVFNCPDGGGEVDPDPDEVPECSDGMDNDGDGLVDHPNDPGCETPDDDDERDPADAGDGDDGDDGNQTEGPQGDETCDDGVDNDDDGMVDEEDPDCNEGAQDGEFCDDGEDNDGDGVTDSDDPDCPDDGDGEAIECSGEGDPISVAVGGGSTGNESAENDDNVIDVNVQSESDHESDCDTVDTDVGSHDTGANNDSDGIDADAGTNNTAVTDDDGIDADAGTNNTAVTDDDGIDADLESQSDAESDDDDIDVDVPP